MLIEDSACMRAVALSVSRRSMRKRETRMAVKLYSWWSDFALVCAVMEIRKAHGSVMGAASEFTPNSLYEPPWTDVDDHVNTGAS